MTSIKKMTCFLLCLCLQAAAQDKRTSSRKEPLFRIYGLYSAQFGDHAYSESYRPAGGFGAAFSFVNLKGFRIPVGFDVQQYHVTDHAAIGNFATTDYRCGYIEPSYEFKVSRSLSFLPKIGVGPVFIYQKRFGSSNGSQFRTGFMTDYKLDDHMGFFLALTYIRSKFNVNVSRDFEEFYNHASEIQIALGVKFK